MWMNKSIGQAAAKMEHRSSAGENWAATPKQHERKRKIGQAAARQPRPKKNKEN
jgi:hypothetical protein